MTPLLTALLEESRQLGFLGPGPVEPHIRHALAYAEAIGEPPARALDLGAGGGLPGLVLATLVWPETRWTFLDGMIRRTEFLEHAVEELELEDRVAVLTGRAEEVARDVDHRERYDAVVARSFGSPAVTAECAAPLLRAGGMLVVSEPPDVDAAAARVRWPEDGLSIVGLGPAEQVVAGTGDAPVHLVRVVKTADADERYPRRTGVPAKRPLF